MNINMILQTASQKCKVHTLVYYEVYQDINEAILREKRIKKWERAWKIKLIEKMNSNWRDLYEEIC